MNLAQKQVCELLDSGQFEAALAKIAELPEESKRQGRMVIAKGDALYELGRDLDALESYAEYLKSFPEEAGRDYALFSAAMCLKNLDLQVEARDLLEKVSPDHEGLEKELTHSELMLEKQKAAREIIADVRQLAEGSRAPAGERPSV